MVVCAVVHTITRPAKSEDIEWILGELKVFSKFIRTKYELYGDEAYSKKGIQMLIDEHIFLIAEVDGNRAGFVSGYFTPHLFNPAIKILCELFWYVNPNYRGAGVGSLLMNEYVAFGKKHAQWITFSKNRFTKLNEKSLLKRGFNHHESTYLQEI